MPEYTESQLAQNKAINDVAERTKVMLGMLDKLQDAMDKLSPLVVVLGTIEAAVDRVEAIVKRLEEL